MGKILNGGRWKGVMIGYLNEVMSVFKYEF